MQFSNKWLNGRTYNCTYRTCLSFYFFKIEGYVKISIEKEVWWREQIYVIMWLVNLFLAMILKKKTWKKKIDVQKEKTYGKQ